MYRMVQTRVETTIEAATDVVWHTLLDVEAYPEWTASMSKVVRVSGAPGSLAVGDRVKITQPKLGSMTWTVTAVDPGRAFDWEVRRAGVKTVARHRITAAGQGSRLELAVDQGGPIGSLIGRLTRNLTRRYMTMEAQGAKARSEAAARRTS